MVSRTTRAAVRMQTICFTLLRPGYFLRLQFLSFFQSPIFPGSFFPTQRFTFSPGAAWQGASPGDSAAARAAAGTGATVSAPSSAPHATSSNAGFGRIREGSHDAAR